MLVLLFIIIPGLRVSVNFVNCIPHQTHLIQFYLTRTVANRVDTAWSFVLIATHERDAKSNEGTDLPASGGTPRFFRAADKACPCEAPARSEADPLRLQDSALRFFPSGRAETQASRRRDSARPVSLKGTNTMETATTPRYQLRKDSGGYFVLDTATRQAAGFSSAQTARQALTLLSAGKHALNEFFCRHEADRIQAFGESAEGP